METLQTFQWKRYKHQNENITNIKMKIQSIPRGNCVTFQSGE